LSEYLYSSITLQVYFHIKDLEIRTKKNRQQEKFRISFLSNPISKKLQLKIEEIEIKGNGKRQMINEKTSTELITKNFLFFFPSLFPDFRVIIIIIVFSSTQNM